MAKQTSTGILKARVPRNLLAAYEFVLKSRPQLLKEYDEKVLDGYDAGVELAYFLHTGSDYDSLRNDLLEKICNAAFRNMRLPLEMVDHGEPSRYGLRRSFVDMLKVFAHVQETASGEEIRTRLKMIRETYLLMRRLIVKYDRSRK
ncbi:MAG: hypothetical protein QXT19_04815 [Candidatus Woesearchaeota archaeon]